MGESVFSQEYGYSHYDITEGLAGSTVYSLTQDKDGFLWASTETGVSRFDGTHFLNFTAADGLPDIEVLQVYGDSQGRVWMAPFRKSVCYYFQGRIHNQDNDSLLRRIHLTGTIQNFLEDTAGNLLIQELSAIHVVGRDGRIRSYDSIGNRPIRASAAVGLDSAGHFLIQADEHIVVLTDSGFGADRVVPLDMIHPNYLALSASYLVSRSGKSQFGLRLLRTGRTQLLPFKDLTYQSISLAIRGDSMLYVNQLSGCMEYDLHTGRYRKYLQGKPVSREFQDRDGNKWFATMGLGIFRLSSDEFQNKVIPTEDVAQTAVHWIGRVGDELWVGNDRNQIYRLSVGDLAINGRFLTRSSTLLSVRILDILSIDEQSSLILTGFSK